MYIIYNNICFIYKYINHYVIETNIALTYMYNVWRRYAVQINLQ